MSPSLPTATTFTVSGTTNIQLPLTTVFQRPSWCDKLLYTYFTKNGNLQTFLRDRNGPGQGSYSSCYPPDFSTFRRTSVEGTYYPGVCPLGYQAFSNGVYSSTSGATAREYFLHESLCCPGKMLLSSFTSPEGSMAFCASKVTTTTVVYLNANEKSTITSPSPWIAADYPIFVGWRSTDLNYFSPKSAPLLTDISSLFVTTKTPDRTPTGTPQNSSDDISPGEGVGIGVGVAVFCCLLVLAGVGFFFLRRRKRRQYRPVGAGAAVGHGGGGPRGAGRTGSAAIYQLDGEARRAEVAGEIPRVEMDGGWYGHELQRQKSGTWPG